MNLSIQFIKDNCKTLSDLKKRIEEVNQSTGMTFKSVARPENKLNICEVALSPFTQISTFMKPQTDILTQININNVQNTETAKADVFRDLGIAIL